MTAVITMMTNQRVLKLGTADPAKEKVEVLGDQILANIHTKEVYFLFLIAYILEKLCTVNSRYSGHARDLV